MPAWAAILGAMLGLATTALSATLTARILRRHDRPLVWAKRGMAIYRTLFLAALTVVFGAYALEAINSRPFSQAEFEHYTGVELCAGDRVDDQSSLEERDTVPGFSYHLRVQLDRSCHRQFEDKVAALWPKECEANRIKASGCQIQDAWPHAKKHTSMSLTPLSPDHYDVRLWE